MRKIKMILSCLTLGLIVCGCEKPAVDTYADISNPSTAVNVGKGGQLTLEQIYSYIRENNDNEISENIMKTIIRSELDFSDEDILDLYNKYLNQEFKKRFVDSGSYNYDGEFDEELLCKYLRSESYNVDCVPVSDSPLDSKYFTYDYSDYIEKELNYDIYLKMLKVQYIVDTQPKLLNKSKGRLVEYYSVSRSSSTDIDTRKTLEEQLNEILKSQSDEKPKDLGYLGELKRNKEMETIDEELEKIFTSSDDTFKYLAKYTTCGNKKCTLGQGEDYQKELVQNKEYYSSEVVKGDNTSILFDKAREVLFGNNIADYLYDAFGNNETYLLSPAYENDGKSEPNLNDIIIFDGSSTYYVVKVKIIDAVTEDFAEKAMLAEMLLDSVSESDLYEHYFKEVDVEIFDKQIREYFVSKYGEY